MQLYSSLLECCSRAAVEAERYAANLEIIMLRNLKRHLCFLLLLIATETSASCSFLDWSFDEVAPNIIDSSAPAGGMLYNLDKNR